MVKKILSSFLVLSLATMIWIPVFTGMTSVARAQEEVKPEQEFATSYDVTYDIGEDGETLVTEKISLRNLTSQYYATQFKLTIGATQISDIKASDSSGPLEVKSTQEGTSTTFEVKFNQQVAGLNKTFPWTLSFKSKDFAVKQGKVWEVSAPKISSASKLENYNLTISVPLSFGEPTLISPSPTNQSTSGSKRFLTYSKSQLENAGVSASFGSFQLFDFDLTFNLENNNLTPILTHIALPPDTAYQDVIFQRIEPKPVNVSVDDDGNYLAWYRLNRGQKISVKAIGSAKLYSNSKVKNPTLDSKLKTLYTQSDKYWEKDNPVIKAKLEEIFGPNPPLPTSEKARLIHRYVVNNLKYNTDRLNNSNIERLGAVTVLSNPDLAVCMEFTDLFISLARAAGIPARELDGYGFTSNPTLRPLSLNRDLLHAWPEYYDESRGWVMIDPTWENTTGGVDYFDKLDLNHFVFAIKGSSSETPVPAGSYKFTDQDSHDVKVVLSEVDFVGKPQLDVKIVSSNPIIAGFPEKIKVTINNMGNSFLPSSDFVIKSDNLNILDTVSKTGPIPAFGYGEFEFNVRTKSLLDSFEDNIEVLVGKQEFNQKVNVQPFLLFRTFPLILVASLGGILLIYLLVLGGFIYRKRYLKNKSLVVSPQSSEKSQKKKL